MGTTDILWKNKFHTQNTIQQQKICQQYHSIKSHMGGKKTNTHLKQYEGYEKENHLETAQNMFTSG